MYFLHCLPNVRIFGDSNWILADLLRQLVRQKNSRVFLLVAMQQYKDDILMFSVDKNFVSQHELI